MQVGDTVKHVKTGLLGVVLKKVVVNRYVHAEGFFWNDHTKDYYYNTIPEESLVLVEEEFVPVDKAYMHSLNEQFVQMALDTRDFVWFDELCKGSSKI